jgi:hypothetical protein
MAGVPHGEADIWAQAIADLRDSVVHDPVDGRTAEQAAARLWSGSGYQDAPARVAEMLVQAIEIGYASALRDVRNGDVTLAGSSGVTDAGAADGGNAVPTTRLQVLMSFVSGVAVFGFGAVTCYSYLFGALRVPGWLLAVGVVSMLLGMLIIIGGGFGGMEARSTDKDSGGNMSSASQP